MQLGNRTEESHLFGVIVLDFLYEFGSFACRKKGISTKIIQFTNETNESRLK